jgi:hypothetical protein
MGASSASAGDIEIQFTATVQNAFGDFGTVLSGGETITGTLVVDDSVAGVFTPAGNPQFQRSEMLYSGAVTSISLSVDGHVLSGTGGDVELLDAEVGSFAGDDTWEADATLGTGSVGGFPAESVLWNVAYPPDGFALAPGDPLIAPPPMVTNWFYQITIYPPGGSFDTIYAFIDDFEVVGGPSPVPALGMMSRIGLMASLVTAAFASFALKRHALR